MALTVCRGCNVNPRHVSPKGIVESYCSDCNKKRCRKRKEALGIKPFKPSSPLCNKCNERPKYISTKGTKSTLCRKCLDSNKNEWRKANRERYNASESALRAKRDKEKLRLASAAQYAKKSKAQVCAEAKRWRDNNPSANKARINRYEARKMNSLGSFTAQEWTHIYNKQGGRCNICFSREALHADHIVPLAKGGCSYAFNIQGLCKSCNCSKQDKVPVGTQYSLFDQIGLK